MYFWTDQSLTICKLSFTNRKAHNMGFYASWAGQTKLQQIAKPIIGSGWTNIVEH